MSSDVLSCTYEALQYDVGDERAESVFTAVAKGPASLLLLCICVGTMPTAARWTICLEKARKEDGYSGARGN